MNKTWRIPYNITDQIFTLQQTFAKPCMPKISTHVSSISKTYTTESLKKSFGECCGSRCWRPPVTGRQVVEFLIRSLCPADGATVHRECWTPTRVFAVTTAIHNFLKNTISSTSARDGILQRVLTAWKWTAVKFVKNLTSTYSPPNREISAMFVQPHDENVPGKIRQMSPAGNIRGKVAQRLTKD